MKHPSSGSNKETHVFCVPLGHLFAQKQNSGCLFQIVILCGKVLEPTGAEPPLYLCV